MAFTGVREVFVLAGGSCGVRFNCISCAKRSQGLSIAHTPILSSGVLQLGSLVGRLKMRGCLGRRLRHNYELFQACDMEGKEPQTREKVGSYDMPVECVV